MVNFNMMKKRNLFRMNNHGKVTKNFMFDKAKTKVVKGGNYRVYVNSNSHNKIIEYDKLHSKPVLSTIKKSKTGKISENANIWPMKKRKE